MAIAEYEVLIGRDAMAVYQYLLDATNLPAWRHDVRSVKLVQGPADSRGAVYRKMVAGRSGLSIPAELEITNVRPGAEIEFHIVSGPATRWGGYYLSTEGSGTRVRFAIEAKREGRFSILNRLGILDGMLQRRVSSDVAQLERLKDVLELQPAV
ncbi:SRPBCC family protein [Arthrobacter sp. SLBN-112]|uniref:SRPBCC family protein n=1 Tax=Arthrobacter sp. SLBN-112 TaxID=2768452 RepID=UPI0027B1678B|nr:SRPBCC family protein [Arthrobacter sp. SLBN-112]MDQ0799417.1 putative membrane protein [Arthrobacter sp. SLBN-112]